MHTYIHTYTYSKHNLTTFQNTAMIHTYIHTYIYSTYSLKKIKVLIHTYIHTYKERINEHLYIVSRLWEGDKAENGSYYPHDSDQTATGNCIQVILCSYIHTQILYIHTYMRVERIKFTDIPSYTYICTYIYLRS
jgi:hypothetical protein